MSKKIGDRFYTTPLFLQATDVAAAPSSPQNDDEEPPRLFGDGIPTSVTVCNCCRSYNVVCYQRPVEGGWYCARCGQLEHLFSMVYDRQHGFERLKELQCFVCGDRFRQFHAFDTHCKSRNHKRTLSRSQGLTASGSSVCIHKDNAVVGELKHKLIHALTTGEQRYRQHVPKERIAELPLLELFPDWQTCEERIVAGGSVDSSSSSPSYRVIHASVNMSESDFNLLLEDLRSESVFGFDTEVAQPSFYPSVRHVSPMGPHLVQLATRKRVWLFSSTTVKAWGVISRLHQLRPPRALPECDNEKVTPASVSVSSGDPPTEDARTEALKMILASPHELVPSSPPSSIGAKRTHCSSVLNVPPDAEDIFAITSYLKVRIVKKGVTNAAGIPLAVCQSRKPFPNEPVKEVSFRELMPQFLEDFFLRDNVALVGFGLTQDIDKIGALMARRNTSRPVAWHPPCVDLSTLFSTDLMMPEAPTSSPDATIIIPSVHMTSVGTVQAAARVFQRRFLKPKHCSTSNWAVPAAYLTTKQIVYACRDAVLPLFMVHTLLRKDQRQDQVLHKNSACNSAPADHNKVKDRLEN